MLTIATAFKNEYVPPLEQEISEFLKKARETLRMGYSKYDAWTIDRERDMVLFYKGGGHDIDSAHLGLWSFIDRAGYYAFSTEEALKSVASPEEIAITYVLGPFRDGAPYATPTTETIACIKDALRERGKWHIFNPEAYKRCQLILIDGVTGKEI